MGRKNWKKNESQKSMEINTKSNLKNIIGIKKAIY